MANDVIPDPANVPGAEGALPAADEGFRDDPASTGVDDDGSGEVMGTSDPLNVAGRQSDEPDFNDPSHLVRHIPDPSDDEVTSDPA